MVSETLSLFFSVSTLVPGLGLLEPKGWHWWLDLLFSVREALLKPTYESCLRPQELQH
jgi:hypothetical protein